MENRGLCGSCVSWSPHAKHAHARYTLSRKYKADDLEILEPVIRTIQKTYARTKTNRFVFLVHKITNNSNNYL